MTKDSPQKTKQATATDTPPTAEANKGKQKNKAAKEEEELSEEDLQLKTDLENSVQEICKGKDLAKHVENLKTQIRSATTSMTSVPKPLKFLRPHYGALKEAFGQLASPNNRGLADVLSILGMTFAEDGSREALKFHFLGSPDVPIGSWGHDYVRHLALEVIEEYNHRSEKEENTDDLMALSLQMVPFLMQHNAEADACDLLIELESLDKLPQFVDKNTFGRVCLYLISSSSFLAAPDDVNTLKIVHLIYRKFDKWTNALTVALKLNDTELIQQDFSTCPDPLVKKQLAYMLARQFVKIESSDESINAIISNSHLSSNFIALARELDVLEAKTPEDIYKSHLENTRPGAVAVDSAKQNLASSFVNAFVNAGFGNDKLMTGADEGNAWIYKNKEHGMLSAAASLGSILLWDVEMGLTHIDKYLYSQDDYIKAGALLAIGMVNTGVRNESDPAMALLSEHLEDKNVLLRIAAIAGLGIAYAGSAREDLLELLQPLVSDVGLTMELSSFAALSLGLIFVGTCHGDIASTILQTLMERDEMALKDTYARYMITALALLYVGKQEAAEATLETLKAIENPLAKQAGVLVESLAYAGTGNVLKVQQMLHECNDHLDKEKDDDAFQGYATIGIALIAMGEEIGSQMALRAFNHLMHYGEPTIRKAVPLALGLLCASNPLVSIFDTLSKYSHDNDHDVAMNSIFAMGLVGAGTNNARLAQMLRQLASYYQKEPDALFMVRIAQGLLHLGKGTLTLNPFHSNRFLMSPAAIAGLLPVLVSFLDTKTLILGKSHWVLYYLITAVYPRFLIALNEEQKSVATTVRVGQAVDTVGQAGRPKTITGFQTHTTPVLLAYTERAELATEEYLPLSDVLEGFVILKKNPEWVDESKDSK